MAEVKDKAAGKEQSRMDKIKDVLKDILKSTRKVFKNISKRIDSFSRKDFGKFTGRHVLLGVFGILVIFVLGLIISNIGNDTLNYPVIYNNDDGKLLLITDKAKAEDAIKLSNSDSVSSVLYANTTERYVLFVKNSALYLYDSKDKDETTKIINDVEDYKFTDDDKFILVLDSDNNLYSYNYKEKSKIDTDVAVFYTNGDKVAYIKDGELFIRNVNGKKDDKTKVTDQYGNSVMFSENGKMLLYMTDENVLYLYNIKKKNNIKIDSGVYDFELSEDGKKLYYVINEDSKKTVYYYNGKDSTKIVSNIYSLLDVDVENEYLVYSTRGEDNKYDIIFKRGTKESATIEKDLVGIYGAFVDEKNVYYYNSDSELFMAKIKGNKVDKPISLGENIGNLIEYKKGFAFVAEVDKYNNGDLYIVKDGKTKKIDSEVYSSLLRVNEDGSKIYYLKDYASNSGDLFVTSGGKGKKIDSDIYTFQVANEKLLFYIKDYSASKGVGDLYRYTGKAQKVADNVTRMATIPSQYEVR